MNIVVLDGATTNPGDNLWTGLEALGQVLVYDQTQPHELFDRACNAEILLTNKVVLNQEMLQQLPRLKFISVMATGVNVVDVAAAGRQHVSVSNAPSYSTDSVAQHVFAGLLALLNRSELHHQAILNGDWPRSGNFSFWKQPLVELAGKSFGIIGLGQIGRAVARIADAMGMQVIATSRSKLYPPEYAGFRWAELDELLKAADVVSLHCPQSDLNQRFINRQRLALMKPTAVLVNTARGGLIDEQDLADALNADQLRGAFLDVVSTEPIADENPLLKAKNCLITPHLGWATVESRRRLMQITVRNVAGFIAGQPINLV